jgi:excisionase family DNA binding protein
MRLTEIEVLKFLTREEARQLLRISTSKLDAETRSGRLKVHRFGRLVRIDVRDLAEYINDAREVAQ